MIHLVSYCIIVFFNILLLFSIYKGVGIRVKDLSLKNWLTSILTVIIPAGPIFLLAYHMHMIRKEMEERNK